MILAPTNNTPSSSVSTSSGAQNLSALRSNNVSSSDLASTSQIKSVNVSLSTSNGAMASTVAGIPPIYSKPSVATINQTQLSPSRSNLSADGLAENSILTGSNKLVDKEQPKDESEDEAIKKDEPAKKSSSPQIELSEEELKLVEELKARDREVKAHEQAHKSVGGQYTGAISYSYQTGPDGKRYAVGGEVPIDVSPVAGDPQATITKMTVVRAAATAPAEPSTQDQAVAAQASMLLAEAQAELVQKRADEMEQVSPSDAAGEAKENRQSALALGIFASVSDNDELSKSSFAVSV